MEPADDEGWHRRNNAAAQRSRVRRHGWGGRIVTSAEARLARIVSIGVILLVVIASVCTIHAAHDEQPHHDAARVVVANAASSLPQQVPLLAWGALFGLYCLEVLGVDLVELCCTGLWVTTHRRLIESRVHDAQRSYRLATRKGKQRLLALWEAQVARCTRLAALRVLAWRLRTVCLPSFCGRGGFSTMEESAIGLGVCATLATLCICPVARMCGGQFMMSGGGNDDSVDDDDRSAYYYYPLVIIMGKTLLKTLLTDDIYIYIYIYIYI